MAKKKKAKKKTSQKFTEPDSSVCILDMPKINRLQATSNNGVTMDAEIIYIAMFWDEACTPKGITQKMKHTDVLPIFADILNKKYRTDFTDSEAWMISQKTTQLTTELKKNIGII